MSHHEEFRQETKEEISRLEHASNKPSPDLEYARMRATSETQELRAIQNRSFEEQGRIARLTKEIKESQSPHKPYSPEKPVFESVHASVGGSPRKEPKGFLERLNRGLESALFGRNTKIEPRAVPRLDTKNLLDEYREKFPRKDHRPENQENRITRLGNPPSNFLGKKK